jgi:hypothetical protein
MLAKPKEVADFIVKAASGGSDIIGYAAQLRVCLRVLPSERTLRAASCRGRTSCQRGCGERNTRRKLSAQVAK